MISEIKSWLWIPRYWIPLYVILNVIGIGLETAGFVSMYLIAYLVLVLLVVIPVTYRSLVGGGCSLRFQICALVKGVNAGVMFLLITFIVDFYLWGALSPLLGVNLSLVSLNVTNLYLIWLMSGLVGGMGARVIEVRGYFNIEEDSITIAGYE